MKITETAIEGLLIIEPRVFTDDRGYFYESYNKTKFAEAGISVDFVQDNQSFSYKGRGQRPILARLNPFTQGKLVRAVINREGTRCCP